MGAKGSLITPAYSYETGGIGGFFATNKDSYLSSMNVNYNGSKGIIYYNFVDKSVVGNNISVVVSDTSVEIIFHNGTVGVSAQYSVAWASAYIAPYTLELRYYTFPN